MGMKMSKFSRTALLPRLGQSNVSFHDKAVVERYGDDSYLLSYNRPVVHRSADGTYHRCWDGWSAATGKHVFAFCGLKKDGYMKMPGEAPEVYERVRRDFFAAEARA